MPCLVARAEPKLLVENDSIELSCLHNSPLAVFVQGESGLGNSEDDNTIALLDLRTRKIVWRLRSSLLPLDSLGIDAASKRVAFRVGSDPHSRTVTGILLPGFTSWEQVSAAERTRIQAVVSHLFVESPDGIICIDSDRS
jgi:hypothetical protein